MARRGACKSCETMYANCCRSRLLCSRTAVWRSMAMSAIVWPGTPSPVSSRGHGAMSTWDISESWALAVFRWNRAIGISRGSMERLRLNESFSNRKPAQQDPVLHADFFHNAVLMAVDRFARQIQLAGHHLQAVAAGQMAENVELDRTEGIDRGIVLQAVSS